MRLAILIDLASLEAPAAAARPPDKGTGSTSAAKEGGAGAGAASAALQTAESGQTIPSFAPAAPSSSVPESPSAAGGATADSSRISQTQVDEAVRVTRQAIARLLVAAQAARVAARVSTLGLGISSVERLLERAAIPDRADSSPREFRTITATSWQAFTSEYNLLIKGLQQAQAKAAALPVGAAMPISTGYPGAMIDGSSDPGWSIDSVGTAGVNSEEVLATGFAAAIARARAAQRSAPLTAVSQALMELMADAEWKLDAVGSHATHDTDLNAAAISRINTVFMIGRWCGTGAQSPSAIFDALSNLSSEFGRWRASLMLMCVAPSIQWSARMQLQLAMQQWFGGSVIAAHDIAACSYDFPMSWAVAPVHCESDALVAYQYWVGPLRVGTNAACNVRFVMSQDEPPRWASALGGCSALVLVGAVPRACLTPDALVGGAMLLMAVNATDGWSSVLRMLAAEQVVGIMDCTTDEGTSVGRLLLIPNGSTWATAVGLSSCAYPEGDGAAPLPINLAAETSIDGSHTASTAAFTVQGAAGRGSNAPSRLQLGTSATTFPSWIELHHPTTEDIEGLRAVLNGKPAAAASTVAVNDTSSVSDLEESSHTDPAEVRDLSDVHMESSPGVAADEVLTTPPRVAEALNKIASMYKQCMMLNHVSSIDLATQVIPSAVRTIACMPASSVPPPWLAQFDADPDISWLPPTMTGASPPVEISAFDGSIINMTRACKIVSEFIESSLLTKDQLRPSSSLSGIMDARAPSPAFAPDMPAPPPALTTVPEAARKNKHSSQQAQVLLRLMVRAWMPAEGRAPNSNELQSAPDLQEIQQALERISFATDAAHATVDDFLQFLETLVSLFAGRVPGILRYLYNTFEVDVPAALAKPTKRKAPAEAPAAVGRKRHGLVAAAIRNQEQGQGAAVAAPAAPIESVEEAPSRPSAAQSQAGNPMAAPDAQETSRALAAPVQEGPRPPTGKAKVAAAAAAVPVGNYPSLGPVLEGRPVLNHFTHSLAHSNALFREVPMVVRKKSKAKPKTTQGRASVAETPLKNRVVQETPLKTRSSTRRVSS